MGRLILRVQAKSNLENESNLDSDWFLEWYDKTGLIKTTAYNWWSSFCKDAGLKLTPKQPKWRLDITKKNSKRD